MFAVGQGNGSWPQASKGSIMHPEEVAVANRNNRPPSEEEKILIQDWRDQYLAEHGTPSLASDCDILVFVRFIEL
jgi:hypothetical protein